MCGIFFYYGKKYTTDKYHRNMVEDGDLAYYVEKLNDRGPDNKPAQREF